MRCESEVTSHIGATRRLLALAAPGRGRFFTACGLGVLASAALSVSSPALRG